MSIIVRTLDNKMLQDTVVGVILHPHRPTLTENSSFIETRAVKNEYRKAELKVLAVDVEVVPGVTDADLGAEWSTYVASLRKGQEPDYEAFTANWVKVNSVPKKKGKDSGSNDKPTE